MWLTMFIGCDGSILIYEPLKNDTENYLVIESLVIGQGYCKINSV